MQKVTETYVTTWNFTQQVVRIVQNKTNIAHGLHWLAPFEVTWVPFALATADNFQSISFCSFHPVHKLVVAEPVVEID